jgi:hypothetical protein
MANRLAATIRACRLARACTPEPVLDQLVERRRVVIVELVLHRGDAVPVTGGPYPGTAELRDLFLDRHPAKKVSHPLGHR